MTPRWARRKLIDDAGERREHISRRAWEFARRRYNRRLERAMR